MRTFRYSWSGGAEHTSPPLVPHVHISSAVGRDFRKEPALPPEFGEIVRMAKLLGEELNRAEIEELVIGESTPPGGTTTAQAVLWAMGYDARTSSASPENPPQSLKEQVIAEGSRERGIERGQLRDNPLEVLRQFGDPMMAASWVWRSVSGKM